jgi:hypothetical protein
MPITLKELTVNFSHLDRSSLLTDWQWLIEEHRLPILITAMGNAFVQDTRDGAVSVLDPGEGKMREVAASVEAFQGLLSDREFVFSEFMVDDFISLQKAGKLLAQGQVFGYIKPPVLGGGFDVANLESTDIEIHFSLSGQIHRQVKDLPDGSPISQVSIS